MKKYFKSRKQDLNKKNFRKLKKKITEIKTGKNGGHQEYMIGLR